MTVSERYRPLAAASNLLVFSSFATLVIFLLVARQLFIANLAIGTGVILISNLIFIGAGMLTPGLVAPGRMTFPLNVTLPLVFCGWICVSVALASRLGNPLESNLEVINSFFTIFKTQDILWFAAAQACALSLSILVSGRRTERESVDSA